MRIVADYLSTPPFEVFRPTGPAVPVLVDSPHSGLAYTAGFLAQTRLDARKIGRAHV